MLEELAKKDKYPISKGFKIDTLKLTVGGARHPTAVDKNDILNKKNANEGVKFNGRINILFVDKTNINKTIDAIRTIKGRSLKRGGIISRKGKLPSRYK